MNTMVQDSASTAASFCQKKILFYGQLKVYQRVHTIFSQNTTLKVTKYIIEGIHEKASTNTLHDSCYRLTC